MKFKNFILYNENKKIKICINCNYCLIFCPKFKILKKKKKIKILNCKICKYCSYFCKTNCIN